MSPFLCEKKGHVLCWVSSKELITISGQHMSVITTAIEIPETRLRRMEITGIYAIKL
jgi:hypothetical protein